MESIMQTITEIFNRFLNTPLDWSAIAILSFVFMFLYMFYQAQKREHLDWTDLITANGSNSVSLTKCLQLVGGVVGTWIMIKTTLNDKITWDLFTIYLTYVASVDGFSKFVSAKYNVNAGNKEEKQPPA